MPKTLIKDRVYEILEKYPETRNCDALLVQVYWMTYEAQYLGPGIKAMEFYIEPPEYSLPLKNLSRVTWPSTIERWRRHIQNKMHRFPPTDRATAKKRRMNMEKWEEMMIANLPPTL